MSEFGVRVRRKEGEKVGVVFIVEIDLKGKSVVLIIGVKIGLLSNFRSIHLSLTAPTPSIASCFLLLD
jgi:hypothetical protein